MRAQKNLSIILALFFLFACQTTIFLSEPSATVSEKYRDILPFSEEGTASYYSYECAKQPMANGKPFDPEKKTCASWFYKFGTVLTVKSLDTGKETEVVVTDRGPAKRLVKEGRIIDLSMKAFEDICQLENGLTRVIVTVKE